MIRFTLERRPQSTKLTWSEIKEVILIIGALDVDIEEVKQFCRRLNDRLAIFGDQEKRKAIEALKVRVVVEQEGLRSLIDRVADGVSTLIGYQISI